MTSASLDGDDMHMRRHSCGNAEIGVIPLSEQGPQQAGNLGHMDDITAEVDERDEYSNDFDDTSSKALCEEGATLSQSHEEIKVPRHDLGGQIMGNDRVSEAPDQATSRTCSLQMQTPVVI